MKKPMICLFKIALKEVLLKKLVGANTRENQNQNVRIDNMSAWTYICGTIRANILGATQAEKTYYLETVLKHLPLVSGSEGNMKPYVVLEHGYNGASNVDEFDNLSNLGEGYWNDFETQSNYLIVLSARLRDREFEQTMREFSKWFYRLAKRVWIDEALVRVSSSFGQEYLYKGENYIDFYDSEENVYALMEKRLGFRGRQKWGGEEDDFLLNLSTKRRS